MSPNPQYTADLFTLLKKSLMENFIFCTVFEHKKGPPPARNLGKNSIYIDYFKQRSLSCLILGFSRRSLPQVPILEMTLAGCKQLPDVLVTTKSTPHKWCRILGFS